MMCMLIILSHLAINLIIYYILVTRSILYYIILARIIYTSSYITYMLASTTS